MHEGTTNTNELPVPAGQLDRLDALSPVDGRYWEQTEALSPYFSEGALIRTRVEVEAKYLIALTDTLSRVKNADGTPIVRNLTQPEKEVLVHLAAGLSRTQLARIKEIEDTTQHDVKAMERGIRETIAGTSLEEVTEFIHFGLTSEDVNNLAYRLMLKRARDDIMAPAANRVVDALAELAHTHRSTPMLARTHGQPAVPTTLGKEMANHGVRLQRQIHSLQDVSLTGKLNGAVGNFNAHTFAVPEVDWIAFSNGFVESLGLTPNLFSTQINPHDDVIQLMQALQRVNGTILDLDRDMWLYISDQWFMQQARSGEVGSSTMPQKVNPIKFENSAGNIEFATDMLGSIGRVIAISRLQRDLESSTVLRNMGTAFAHCLVAYTNTLNGMQRVRPNLAELGSALQDNFAVLTEAVQTLLRRNGARDPYTMIAKLTRGGTITPDQWQQWLETLPAEIDDATRTRLQALTPDTYTGQAAKLTDLALEEIARLRR